MYTGRYYHKIDSKHRFSLPAQFRKDLGKNIVVTKGLDGCLFIFDEEVWEKKLKETAALEFTKKVHRDFVRLLTNEAENAELDAHGRCRISEHLGNQASLRKDIVIVGSLDRVEVWDQARYHTYLTAIESHAEEIAEAVSERKGQV